MTLKVGDKVRLVRDLSPLKEGDIGTVTEAEESGMARVRVPGRRDSDARCGGWLAYTERHSTVYAEVEKIEDEQPRPLGLRAGDKVVNLKTGREGLVLKGPISGELKVYDQNPPIKTAVPAQALEEYEFHYPGTYDVWRRVTVPATVQAQPW